MYHYYYSNCTGRERNNSDKYARPVATLRKKCHLINEKRMLNQ